MVAPATSPISQLLADCRAEPIVFDGVRSELCPALEQVILGRMQSDHGRRQVGSINVGGWKSGEDFFSWSEQAVQELRQVIVETVGAKSPIAWAMVNRAGSQHPRHQHRAAILSGVYYVTSGSADAITPTIFECPCDGGPGRFVRVARPTRGGDRYELEVDPHPGRLVICRGEMWHRLPAYHGDLPRITIAFDVRR
jgi:hypothetical protein